MFGRRQGYWSMPGAVAVIALLAAIVLVGPGAGQAYAQSPEGEAVSEAAAAPQSGGMMGMMGGMGMMEKMGGQQKMEKGPAYDAPWGQSYWTVSLDDVKKVANDFLADLDANLSAGEVVDFGDHFYVEAVERDTGIGAHELAVFFKDSKGRVLPATGPNLEWNLKYGTSGTDVRPEEDSISVPALTVTAEKALEYAQLYLDEENPGSTAGDTARPFYGYYNVNVSIEGEVVGVLAVNGYNGRIWYRHSPAEHAAHAGPGQSGAPGAGSAHESHHPAAAESAPEPAAPASSAEHNS